MFKIIKFYNFFQPLCLQQLFALEHCLYYTTLKGMALYEEKNMHMENVSFSSRLRILCDFIRLHISLRCLRSLIMFILVMNILQMLSKDFPSNLHRMKIEFSVIKASEQHASNNHILEALLAYFVICV